MPVTEIGGMRVRPGVDPLDDATPEGQIVSKAYKKIASEPTGPYRLYYGLEVENPEYFWGFFDFASVEDHKKFAEEHAGPLVRDFDKVFLHSTEPRDRAALFMSHIQPVLRPEKSTPASSEATGTTSPYPLRSIRSPVTEIMFAFFPATISSESKASVNGILQQFIDQGLSKCADVQAVDYGWAIETDIPVRGTGGGEDNKDGKDTSEPQKGALLWAGIGWPSIDAHVKFTETDAFKDSVGLLGRMEGLISITMFHVKFRGWENTLRKD